jgi:flagellar basal body-associated protein FliL
MPATVPEAAARGALGDARAERPSPFSLAGFIIMLVAMALEAIVLVVLLKPEPLALARQAKPGEEAPKLTTAELLAPTVDMPEVVVSVPVKGVGAELMTAVVSITVKLGKAEGRSEEELDNRYLQKVYVPKLQALMPKFRHELITALSSRVYDELRSRDVQNNILDEMKKSMNATLKEYGVEPRVTELYWNSFHFD